MYQADHCQQAYHGAVIAHLRHPRESIEVNCASENRASFFHDEAKPTNFLVKENHFQGQKNPGNLCAPTSCSPSLDLEWPSVALADLQFIQTVSDRTRK